MEPLINIQNLSHFYGDFCAVDNISFELYPGEVLGFLGPNGAGKSTTMRILSGVLAPSSGQVLLNGIDLLADPLVAKVNLGYLPEHPPLYPDMTVNEYLIFCARLHHIEKTQLKQAVDQAKQQCGLTDSGRRLIANLSKGYQQRVGIAQAIIHNPKVIILDEPTSGLDPNQIQEIRALIRELAEQCGIILSTHILPEVQAVCDRVQILNQGKLVFSEQLQLITDKTEQLVMVLGAPPEIDELADLPGVTQAEKLNEGKFRLALTTDADPAVISERAVRNGWHLLELTPEKQDLEHIFTQLTTMEIT